MQDARSDEAPAMSGQVRDAAAANRALGAAGQSDMVWGHASIRDAEGRGVWMKASGWAFEEITDELIVLVSQDGEVLAGEGERHVEYPIHTEVMAARPDVNCVVHTHGMAANAFSSLDVPLLAISHDGSLFASGIPRFTLTANLIRTPELGTALAETIGQGPGCLIPQHGLVTVGENAATAVMRCVLLERACRVQLDAMAAGTIKLFTDVAAAAEKAPEAWGPKQFTSGYRYLCRQAGIAD